MAARTGKCSSVRSRLLTRITLLALLVSASFAALPAVASAACPANTPPVASFNYSPSAPEVGQSVTFDGSGSFAGMSWFPGFVDPVTGEAFCTPLPSAISSYSWDWGDGSPPSSGPTASHAFAAAGTYNVTLTVTSWATDTETKAVTVTAPPSSGGGDGGTPPPGGGGTTPPPGETTPPPGDTTPPPHDTDPPETTITKGAPNTTEKTSIKFKFISDEPGSTFQCKSDKKPWKPCTSPKKVKRLDDGKHKFLVRATDAAGNVDTSAAKDKFEVEG